jgi:DNA polymerase-3 subunit delta'
MAEDPLPNSMRLHPHWGHTSLLQVLARAHLEGSLPAALLIHGAKGIGKQHLALWLSRLLLCEAPGPGGPCEECHACYLAGKLEHPDLHWYFPLPRPKKASTPDKLAQALEDARGEVLKEIRANPLRTTGDNEPKSLYLAAARSLRRKAQRRPSSGDRQVFIIADAETLAPQESSSEAANALLKLLEEPPSGTTLILTSAEPGRLLPTIRSRTTQLHVPPLSQAEVTEFLISEAGVEEGEAHRVGGLSKGAIGRALGFLREGEEPGPLEQTRIDALGLLSAALAAGPERTVQSAITFKPVGARGLRDLFDFLEECLGELARAACGLPLGSATPIETEFYIEAVVRWKLHPASVPLAMRRVDDARALAAGNVNPQLIIFGLLHDLREELTSPSHAPNPGR